MRFFEFVLKLNGKFPVIRKISQAWVKKAVLDPMRRSKLNNLYHQLSYYEKSIFHALFGRIFRDGNTYEIDGYWTLKFAGKEIQIPLNGDSLWLDWETALSVLGHDYEIKSFYEQEITSPNPPSCFLDIGANYGTHSLLFLKSGILVISIEPNPECKPYFERMARFNQVKGEWFGIALGEEEGKAEIVFPEGETWLGSLKEIDFTDRKENIKSYQIDVDTLDNFLLMNNFQPDLIKIDTEGFEVSILNGGSVFIATSHPKLIFEANSEKEFEALNSFFKSKSYKVFSLKNIKSNSLKSFPKNEDNFISFETQKI